MSTRIEPCQGIHHLPAVIADGTLDQAIAQPQMTTYRVIKPYALSESHDLVGVGNGEVYIRWTLQGPLLQTWINLNPSMDK